MADGADGLPSSHPATGNPRWYQQAVFYELLPRGFFDSNADGVGDFEGLRQKLDYLQWLGIDCVWLLPFYPSPLHDGGYDISDFLTVAPISGLSTTSWRWWKMPIAGASGSSPTSS